MAKKVVKKTAPKKSAGQKTASAKGKVKYTYLFGAKTDGYS